MTTRATIGAACCALALLAAGCGGSSGTESAAEGGGEPARGGTLRIAQITDVVTFDPVEATDNESIRVLSQVVEPLFRSDGRGGTEPWLAQSGRTSRDGLTWTIELRRGVTFSDGSPLEASDVVFSLDRVRRSATWGLPLASVKRVRAVDADTVEIVTRTRTVSLLSTLSLFASGIVPERFGGRSADAFGQNPVGTGPFVVGRWAKGQSVTLTPNRGYWRRGHPLLDEVVISAVPDANSRVSQLRGGQQDAIAAPPWSQVDGLESASGLKVTLSPLARTDLLLLYSQRPVFRDPVVREAVSLAIDREAIAETVLRGRAEPTGSFIPPAVRYFDAELEPDPFDVERARELLAQSSARGRAAITITVLSGDDVGRDSAQIMQQTLEQAGFKVTIRSMDAGAVGELAAAGDLDATVTYLTSDIDDPSELAAYYAATNAFGSATDVSVIAELAKRADGETDSDRRADLYGTMQRLARDDRTAVPLVAEPFVWAMDDDVRGLEVGLSGIYSLADVSVGG